MRGSAHLLVLTMMATAAAAQVHLPAIPPPGGSLLPPQRPLSGVESTSLEQLSNLRHLVIDQLIRANPRLVGEDRNGEPVVLREILGLSPTEAALDRARSLGFTVDREQTLDAMNLRLVVFATPRGMSTMKALRTLRDADPGGSYDYNHIYTGSGEPSQSGASRGAGSRGADSAGTAGGVQPQRDDPSRVRIGLLDSGVDVTHPVFRDAAIHAWGCDNRPVPTGHGTSVASLLIGRSEGFNGVRPEAELYAADVFCGRPTGGAVDTLVAALGWLVQEKVPVINISLVGPKNVMLEKVIGSLIAGGYLIVAAVGNDGPAAPPLYPASYQHVVGVTAVDAHRHVLIEAARGPQVMFASPGADMAAAGSDHTFVDVRGTSFAAPLVAALLATGLAKPDTTAAAAAVDALAKTAVDLGSPGRDLTYGYGLVGADYRIDPAPLIRR